jgi:nitrogen fixation NifU-like protein
VVSDKLRALMIEGAGAGELAGASVRHGRAEHAVCGDVVELSVRTEGVRIADLRWRANGCPASMAVAALAAKVLPGTDLAEAEATLHAGVVAHGGLLPHERHAERLLLAALSAAR